MKPKETIRMGVIALTGLVEGIAGCSRGPSEALCNDMHFGSRPVEGACLVLKFKDVADLRRQCRGRVEKVEVILCECRGIKGPMWSCIPDKDSGLEN